MILRRPKRGFDLQPDVPGQQNIDSSVDDRQIRRVAARDEFGDDAMHPRLTLRDVGHWHAPYCCLHSVQSQELAKSLPPNAIELFLGAW